MNGIAIILKEQWRSVPIIFRIARYEDKATYQSHYLGLAWQILNPLIQVGIYYLIFGLGMRGGRTVAGVPFIIWMLLGIVPWFFMSTTILGCSNSIYKQIGLVSKMKFPISILPAVTLVSNFVAFFSMFTVVLMGMLSFGMRPTLYWFQFFYYFSAMLLFLYFVGLFNATVTVLIRDYHIALQSSIRLLFYLTGAIWDFTTSNFPEWLKGLLTLNPLYYLLNGFRDSFLSRQWFWEKPSQTLFFWLIVLFIIIAGSTIHLRFRDRFMNYI